MNTKKLALSAASLLLVLAFLACNFAGLGGEAPGSGGAAPGGARTTSDPSFPTNTDGAETIVIPGGTFWMGSENTDVLADGDELPRHQVTLGSFPICIHEVTNERKLVV
jgi:formylglycine-generating enzyme required for sulfatase activity